MYKHIGYKAIEIDNDGKIIRERYIIIRPEWRGNASIFTLCKNVKQMAYVHFRDCEDDTNLEDMILKNDYAAFSHKDHGGKKRNFLLEPLSPEETEIFRCEFTDNFYNI